MKKFIFQSVLILILIAAALFIFKTGPNLTNLPFVPQPETAKQVEISGTKINVEIADTQAKRKQGLSGRTALGLDQGMLFIFSKSYKPAFWMKGLAFPLDIIWIKDNKVVDISVNLPPPAPNTPDVSLPIYQPKEDINKALEVNAGTAQRINIKVGDSIKVI